MTEDSTVEATCLLLLEQPRGLLLARDEIHAWINSFDSYKAARGADVGHWLRFWNGGEVTIDRKTGRRTIRVPRASVSVTGTAQPKPWGAALAGRYRAHGSEAETMDKPDGEHHANGLAPRFLMAMPPRRPKKWTDDEISDTVRRQADELFGSLLSLPLAVDENGEPQPADLRLTAPAKELWVRYFEQHAGEAKAMDEGLAAIWSKTEGYAARLALVLFLVRWASGETSGVEVDANAMDAGIALAVGLLMKPHGSAASSEGIPTLPRRLSGANSSGSSRPTAARSPHGNLCGSRGNTANRSRLPKPL